VVKTIREIIMKHTEKRQGKPLPISSADEKALEKMKRLAKNYPDTYFLPKKLEVVRNLYPKQVASIIKKALTSLQAKHEKELNDFKEKFAVDNFYCTGCGGQYPYCSSICVDDDRKDKWQLKGGVKRIQKLGEEISSLQKENEELREGFEFTFKVCDNKIKELTSQLANRDKKILERFEKWCQEYKFDVDYEDICNKFKQFLNSTSKSPERKTEMPDCDKQDVVPLAKTITPEYSGKVDSEQNGVKGSTGDTSKSSKDKEGRLDTDTSNRTTEMSADLSICKCSHKDFWHSKKKNKEGSLETHCTFNNCKCPKFEPQTNRGAE
jgi:hypothetical protein